MSKLQVIRVEFGTFDYAFTCVVGPSADALRYVRRKFDWPDYSPDMNVRGKFFYDYSDSRRSPVIWIPRKPRTPREHGTLAHEVLHVVRDMLVDWAGVRLNHETDEAFCHAVGHAVTTILEKLR